MENKLKSILEDVLENVKFYVYVKPYDFLRNIWWFFHNIKHFKKDLWEFRNWDYSYCINIFTSALNELHDCLMDGNEVTETRMKKVEAIEELIWLIEHDPEDNDEIRKSILKEYDEWYFDNRKKTAKEIKEHHRRLRKYIQTLNELEDKRLKRIFRIIKGQTSIEVDTKKIREKYKKEHPDLYKQFNGYNDYEFYAKLFDGTGYKGWWD